MSKVNQCVAAGRAAILAARNEAPSIELGDLISGMISLAMTTMSPAAIDRIAVGLTVDIVQMVGARRVRDLVDRVSSAGAGSAFS